MATRIWRLIPALLLSVAGLLSCNRPAQAVPSFAAQTGQPCTACHIGAFGPQLTGYGRAFKIGGYTLAGGEGLAAKIPLAGFVQTSFTHTQANAAPGTYTDYGTNNNFTLDQASLFVAGRINDYAGAFIQTTYDGVGKSFFLDNSDVRLTTPVDIGDTNLRIGLSLNNGPTVQDPFNSSMVWGPPYEGSALAPSPSYEPILMGAFQSYVAGLTAYAWYDNALYAEFGAYRSMSDKLSKALGTYGAAPGNIPGYAPYARLAYEWDWGGQTAHLGAIAMQANVQPGEINGIGTDRYTDLSIDGSYQYIGDGTNIVTFLGSFTHEYEHFGASVGSALGAGNQAPNLNDTLSELRANVTYFYQNTYGGSVGVKRIWGSSDPVMYANGGNNRPDSTALLLEADWVPFGKDESFGQPFANMKLGVQYTYYPEFNGSTAGATGNNTLYAFAWFAF